MLKCLGHLCPNPNPTIQSQIQENTGEFPGLSRANARWLSPRPSSAQGDMIAISSRKKATYHQKSWVCHPTGGRDDLSSTSVDWLSSDHGIQDLKLHISYSCEHKIITKLKSNKWSWSWFLFFKLDELSLTGSVRNLASSVTNIETSSFSLSFALVF